jgi:hypothetical protein
MMGNCAKCGEHGYVLPLHDERGGPPFCFMCAGAWHAEHAPRRRARRVLIKALKAYAAAGGHLFGKDFDELKLAASPFFGLVLPGDADSDFSDLTSELLAATIALTHPDKHPPERRAEANRVTQELTALKPFVFPAPPPEPPPKPSDVCSDDIRSELSKPSRPYPCEDCRYAVPDDYCDPCKAQWGKEREEKAKLKDKKRQQKNAHQRDRYRWKASKRSRYAQPTVCGMCGNAFKPKRSDAQYCSAACRQRAYVKRDGKPSNSKPLGREQIERAIKDALTSNPNNAFTADDLCDRVYVGLKRPQRKHRATVIPVAKKVCKRLGENWDWWRTCGRGGPLLFWNRASVTSYAMARLKSDVFNRYRCRDITEKKLRAKIAPGGQKHKLVVKGGAWWQHCQEDIAKFKHVTANQNKAGGNLASRHAQAAP